MRDYAVTYMKCQSCAAKVNCHECDAYLKQDLQTQAGVEEVRANMKQKTVSLETCLSEEEVEEVLEDRGLFI